MNESTLPTANGQSTPEKPASMRRRTVIGAAAWAAPVIVASVASPAAAVSVPGLTLTLVAPPTAEVGTLAPEAVYATVLVDGVPAPGTSVTFMLADPGLAGFGPGEEQSVTVVTDDAGNAYPPALVLKAAGDVVVSATTGDRSQHALISVTAAAPAGTIAFLQPAVSVAAASTFALSGALTRTSGAGYPAEVAIGYPSGFSGPETVPVDQSTGAFTVPGIAAGVDNGPVTASAPGFGRATVAITVVLGYISTERAWYRAGVGLGSPYNLHRITGTVHRVTPDAALPDFVTVNWYHEDYQNLIGFTDGLRVRVDPVTGAFTLPPLSPSDNGRLDGATQLGSYLRITAQGYEPMHAYLTNHPTDRDAALGMSTTPAVTRFAPGEVRDISGIAAPGVATAVVNYLEGFTGPQTVAVRADGTYTVRGVKAPDHATAAPIYLSGPYSMGWLIVL